MGANTSQQAFAALQVSAGEGTTTTYRDIDLHGFWAAGEGHAITANYGTTTSDIVGQIVFQHDNPGSKIKFGRLYDSGNQSTYPMELVSDGGSANLTITGKVGIGTTNPTSKLYIEGGSANWNETTPGLSVGTIHLDPGVSTNDFGNAITFGASDASSGTDAQAGIYVRSDGAYGTKMYFATTDAYVTGSKTRMYISEGGSVGIGNTAPSQILHVTGNIRVTGAYYDSGNSPGTSGQILSSTATGTSWIAAPSGGITGSGTTNYVPKFTSSSAIGNSAIYDNSGNIGIGETAAASVLTVRKDSATGRGGEISIINYGGTGAGASAALNFGLEASTYDADSGNAQIKAILTGGSGITDMVFSSWTGAAFTEKIRILSGGNVGIGTTAPVAELNVVGTSTEQIVVSYDSTKRMLLGRTTGYGWIQPYTNAVSYDNLILNRDGGNVGIGTTGPLAKLEVNAGAGTPAFNNGIAIVTGNSTYTTGHGGILQFQNEDVITAAIRGVRESGWGSGMALYTHNTSSGNTFGTTVVERMRITEAGNVGIGTTGPITKLEVYGGHSDTTARLYSIGNNAGSDASLDMWASEPGVTYDGSGIGNNVNGHPYYGRRNAGIAQSYIRFYNGGILLNTGSTTASQTVTVLASGNVGINNTGPSYRLDVAGDARITSGSLGVGVAPNATDGRIDASNDIVAFQTSDRRLKENITPITNALEKVKSLTGVMFDWKEETKSVHGYEGHDVGIIAQDVQAILPEAVRTNDTGYLSVRYEKMIALLIEGMKEQQLQIDELKSKLK
jgi:hypothetical protein